MIAVPADSDIGFANDCMVSIMHFLKKNNYNCKYNEANSKIICKPKRDDKSVDYSNIKGDADGNIPFISVLDQNDVLRGMMLVHDDINVILIAGVNPQKHFSMVRYLQAVKFSDDDVRIVDRVRIVHEFINNLNINIKNKRYWYREPNKKIPIQVGLMNMWNEQKYFGRWTFFIDGSKYLVMFFLFDHDGVPKMVINIHPQGTNIVINTNRLKFFKETLINTYNGHILKKLKLLDAKNERKIEKKIENNVRFVLINKQKVHYQTKTKCKIYTKFSNDNLFKRVCYHCGKNLELSHLYRCKGCKIAIYCSRKCQKRDWSLSKHGEICKNRRLVVREGNLSIDHLHKWT